MILLQTTCKKEDVLVLVCTSCLVPHLPDWNNLENLAALQDTLAKSDAIHTGGRLERALLFVKSSNVKFTLMLY